MNPEPPFEHQLQHMLAQIMQALNQGMECGVYCVDGAIPVLHRFTCSIAQPFQRQLGANFETPSWVKPNPTDYGPSYELEGDDS